MEILAEALRAIVIVGLPICLFSLATVWWALYRGHFLETEDFTDLEDQIKAMSRSKKNKNKNENNITNESDPDDLILKKWIKFGGGFYGIVAMFTWLVIEFLDIGGMILEIGGFMEFLKSLDIGVIFRIFVEGLKNFIAALIWPLYWLKRIDTTYAWLWFVVAYGGYWLGLKLAITIRSRS